MGIPPEDVGKNLTIAEVIRIIPATPTPSPGPAPPPPIAAIAGGAGALLAVCGLIALGIVISRRRSAKREKEALSKLKQLPKVRHLAQRPHVPANTLAKVFTDAGIMPAVSINKGFTENPLRHGRAGPSDGSGGQGMTRLKFTRQPSSLETGRMAQNTSKMSFLVPKAPEDGRFAASPSAVNVLVNPLLGAAGNPFTAVNHGDGSGRIKISGKSSLGVDMDDGGFVNPMRTAAMAAQSGSARGKAVDHISLNVPLQRTTGSTGKHAAIFGGRLGMGRFGSPRSSFADTLGLSSEGTALTGAASDATAIDEALAGKRSGSGAKATKISSNNAVGGRVISKDDRVGFDVTTRRRK
jgi:hypothetical protein